MKRFILFAAADTLALASCSEDVVGNNNGQNVDDANTVKAIVAPFKSGRAVTRTSVTPGDNNGATLALESGDKLGVFSQKD